MEPLRIGLVGTRGPGFYGGFETCVAELAPRLAAMGHDVRVYSRRAFRSQQVDLPDVEIVSLPSIGTKNLDTFTHTAVTTAHIARHRLDVVICFGVGNAPWAWAISHLLRIPVVFNVDGLDRVRDKWGTVGRWYLGLSERVAVPAADLLITDAREIQTYFTERYGAESEFIAYGVPEPAGDASDEVTNRGLEPGGYVLYVSRLEPENRPEDAIEAHARSGIDAPLVIVGGSRYDPAYERKLQTDAHAGVVFCGFVYGEGYRQLQRHAGLYLQCTSVGGTHPALVEAMAAANAVVAYDTPEQREVLGPAGRYYRTTDELADQVRELWARPEDRTSMGAAASDRARSLYSWDAVAADYDAACKAVLDPS